MNWEVPDHVHSYQILLVLIPQVFWTPFPMFPYPKAQMKAYGKALNY